MHCHLSRPNQKSRRLTVSIADFLEDALDIISMCCINRVTPTSWSAFKLMYAALVLLAITLGVNILGTLVLQRAMKRFEGQR